MKNYLETSQLSVGYQGKTLIEQVALSVRRGQIVTLIGPNGSGKSTILKTIVGQLPAVSGSVFLDGEDIHLTQIEFRILELLARHAGRVLTYDFMIKNIWGPNAAFDKQILRVNMANIRRKIEKNPAAPQYLRTEIGVGYWIREGD